MVDFAAMRDAMSKLGGDPSRINPICPADLVIDHSVQVLYMIYILASMPLLTLVMNGHIYIGTVHTYILYIHTVVITSC